MRYFYQPSAIPPSGTFGITYSCDHPLCNACTLFRIGEYGLGVVMEHYDPKTKHRWWGPIPKALATDIYLNPNFYDYFFEHSDICRKELYPIVKVRSIMYALKMKPLKKEIWE